MDTAGMRRPTQSHSFSMRKRPPILAVMTAAVPNCDVLLFVTTPSEKLALERQAAELGFVADWQGTRRSDEKLGMYFDLGHVGSHRVLAVPTAPGAFAARGSAARGVLFQAVTRARALIAVGMAFGMSRKEQQLGEVLVSRRLFPYDIREVHDRGAGWTCDWARTDSVKAHGGLITMFERASKRGQFPFRVSFGTILSGGARISSGRFRDELGRAVMSKSCHGTPIGGDMEGAGFLSVSRRWIVVKAISDFADGPVTVTDDTERTRACQNAVQLVLTTLQNDAFDAGAMQ